MRNGYTFAMTATDRTSRLPWVSPAVERRGAENVVESVPRGLRVAAALGWRLLVVAVALWVIGQIIAYLSGIFIPVAIALLLAALLTPAVKKLTEWRVPRGLATAMVLVGGLAALGVLMTFVVRTVVGGVPQLGASLNQSIGELTDWLANGPLHVSATQLQSVQQQVQSFLQSNVAGITAATLTTAATIGELLTEFLLVVFTLIFFLHDGGGIWGFLTKVAPDRIRTRVDVAGRRGLAALVHYVRATAVVAAVDAIVIGIALGILGVPLAVPLATLVFIGAFIPIIGAVTTGAVSVLVALVAQGPITSLIVLAVIIGVMQLESHVLQPLLLGRAVALHPLAVVLAIGTGLFVWGIAGALLAVPLLAVLNAGIRSLTSSADALVAPEDVHLTESEDSAAADTPDSELE
ncbi:MAG: putative heme transporter [Pseudonocardiales bacterium]|jgi:predicted PurR-regulated permease PerM|nr:putative heme transporter [Pseudonocardiales bacterium]MDT7576746.1 putative heme transporter [Pseudonocardiales bacterium]